VRWGFALPLRDGAMRAARVGAKGDMLTDDDVGWTLDVMGHALARVAAELGTA
jgi:hypothetical protein